eukprot:TRINITY_DN4997_c0_g4_i1.p1 TRINITY_DN4997_c0_g4~~TRINITY_DN4997_c0_g4_i1.p1  ORF type:complete len:1568 (+),score=358.57 TRINITY_DN4997_c0_g4_i1:68-4771(+)
MPYAVVTVPATGDASYMTGSAPEEGEDDYYPDSDLADEAEYSTEPAESGEPGWDDAVRWFETRRHTESWTEAEEREYLDHLSAIFSLSKGCLSMLRAVPGKVYVMGNSAAAGSYVLAVGGEPLRPRLWHGEAYWVRKRGIKSVLHYQEGRWAVGRGLGRGPGMICSVNDDVELPTLTQAWQENMGGWWGNSRGTRVVAAPGTPVWIAVEFPSTATTAAPPRRWVRVMGKLQARRRASAAVRAARSPQRVSQCGLRLGAAVFCRDEDAEPWRVGTVTAFAPDGAPLVSAPDPPRDEDLTRPAARALRWEGRRRWKHVRVAVPPLVDPPRVGERFAMPDVTGEWYPVEVTAVHEGDPPTYTVLVEDGGARPRLWERVPLSLLFPEDGMEHEVARWRGRAQKKGKEAPYRPVVGAPLRAGERVEVRDHSDEEWMPGQVASDGLIVPDQWRTLGKRYRWRHIRRPQAGNPIPGARRALIVACDYLEQSAQLGGSFVAAEALEAMLAREEWGGPVRMLAERPGAVRPTRHNIAAGMRWLCENAGTGDALFFAFIGRSAKAEHGPLSGNAVHGLAPCDLLQHGPVMCTELLDQVPARARLTLVLDVFPSSDSPLLLPQRLTSGADGGVVLGAAEVVGQVRPADIIVITSVSPGDEDSQPWPTTAGSLSSAFAAAVAGEPPAYRLLRRMRRNLVDVLRDQAPLPQLCSSAPFTEATLLYYSGEVLVPSLIGGPVFLGIRPRNKPRPPPDSLPDSIDVRGATRTGINGRYQLVPSAGSGWVRRRWQGAAECGRYTIYWDDGCWWLGSETRDEYRSCDTDSPLPPIASAHWQPWGEEPDEGTVLPPFLELRYSGGHAASHAAMAEETPARLLHPVRCDDSGRDWPEGTLVRAVIQVDGSLMLRFPDNTLVRCGAQSVEPARQEEEWLPGDVVAVRDADHEEWMPAVVVAPSGDGLPPRVRPRGEAVTWSEPQGYRFAQVERVRVGLDWESMDASGNWWPVTVTAENDDGTFQCEVRDGSGVRKHWPHVFPGNLRRPLDRVRPALQSTVQDWRSPSRDRSQSLPARSSESPSAVASARPPDGESLGEGAKVLVRDLEDEEWMPGAVVGRDNGGRPLVAPEGPGWEGRGPYVWRELRRQEEAKPHVTLALPPEAAAAEEAWPGWVPRTLVVRSPSHSLHCGSRLFQTVRFTPGRHRDPSVEAVQLGCLELYTDCAVRAIARPLTAWQEGGRPVKTETGQGLARCAANRGPTWWCSVGGALVLQLKHPAELRGYRLQTSGGPPGGDPVEWTLELCQNIDSEEEPHWVMWEECAMELPMERFAWSEMVTVPLPRLPEACPGGRLSDSCAAVRGLGGLYELRGSRADAVHCRPVWARPATKDCIYMSADAVWTIGPWDPAAGLAGGVARGADAQQMPYQQQTWEAKIIKGGSLQWSDDQEVSVSAGTAEELREWRREVAEEARYQAKVAEYAGRLALVAVASAAAAACWVAGAQAEAMLAVQALIAEEEAKKAKAKPGGKKPKAKGKKGDGSPKGDGEKPKKPKKPKPKDGEASPESSPKEGEEKKKKKKKPPAEGAPDPA